MKIPKPVDNDQNKRPNQWKNLVDEKIEIKNKTRLIDDCHKMVDGQKVKKTKTAHIVEQLKSDQYTRIPSPELRTLTKQETKTIVIFSGTTKFMFVQNLCSY